MVFPFTLQGLEMEQMGIEMSFQKRSEMEIQGRNLEKAVTELELISKGIREGFATDLYTPNMNPKPLRNSGTLIQTILHACNDSLLG
jgi:hypothetical protein